MTPVGMAFYGSEPCHPASTFNNEEDEGEEGGNEQTVRLPMCKKFFFDQLAITVSFPVSSSEFVKMTDVREQIEQLVELEKGHDEADFLNQFKCSENTRYTFGMSNDSNSWTEESFNRKQELIGVAAVDLRLHDIMQVIKTYQFGPTGYPVVYERHRGNIIIHPFLRTSIHLEGIDFHSDAAFDVRIDQLEPDIFYYKNDRNLVKIKKSVNDVLNKKLKMNHTTPVDELGNFVSRSVYLEHYNIDDSPFALLCIFDADFKDYEYLESVNSKFKPGEHPLKYRRKQALYKCDQLNDQVGGGLGYQKIVCALKNLKSKTQLREPSESPFSRSGGLADHMSRMDLNIPRTGSDAFLADSWNYCWWTDMNNTCARGADHEDYSCCF